MTQSNEPDTEHDAAFGQQEEGTSLLTWATLLLRWRRTITVLGFIGGVIGLLSGLLSPRLFVSRAVFLPQGSEESMSAIALAASQFGVDVPSGGKWWPSVYVSVLQSRALLEPIVNDTFTVTEEGNRRATLIDLMEIKGKSDGERTARAIKGVREFALAGEDRRTGAVHIQVSTEWPSISYALARRLLDGVQDFNRNTRTTLAAAEREFVDGQLGEAARNLRVAEDRLQEFLQNNRGVGGSPQLVFQQDRLQRNVVMAQEIYRSLAHSRQEARIREVRNTPVVSLIEDPRIAAIGEPRGSVLKALIGGFLGGLLGIVIAVTANSVAQHRSTRDGSAFFHEIEQMMPRPLRNWIQRQ